MKMIKSLLVFLAAASFMVSCQNDSVSEDTEALNGGSQLTAVLKSMSVNDTESDNIIDSTSCFKVVLPVNVVANHILVNVFTEDDFQDVEALFDQNADDTDTVYLLFPITVQTQDYQEITVGSQEEFDALTGACTATGGYIGDECVSLVFPLTIYSYNSGFQMQDTYKLNNNQELYTMLGQLGPNEYYSIGYPVSLNVKDGAGVTVNNNDELSAAISNALQGCQVGGCTNPQILTEGLALYITFSNGIAKDLKGNTVNAPDNIAFTADRNGNQNCAVVFNGSQFLQVPESMDNAITQGEPYSISLWVRLQNTNSNDVEKLFAKGNITGQGFELAVKDLNAPVFTTGNSVTLLDSAWKTDAALPVDTQNWHHLVIVADAINNIKLYRDGELRNSLDSSSAFIGIEAADYYIGNGFTGYLDDLRLYKKALSPQEVQTLFELEGDCNTCLE